MSMVLEPPSSISLAHALVKGSMGLAHSWAPSSASWSEALHLMPWQDSWWAAFLLRAEDPQ